MFTRSLIRPVVVAFAALAVACGKPARAPALAAARAPALVPTAAVRAPVLRPPLASCARDEPSPGVVELRCARFQATVMAPQLEASERSPLDLAEASLRRQAVLKVERSPRVIGGKPRDAVRFSARGGRGPTDVGGTMVVIPTAHPGVVRLVNCGGPHEVCDAALEALADFARTDRSAAMPREAATAPTFAGRALALPPHCQHIAMGTKTCIRCGAHSVCYTPAGPDAPPGIDWLFDAEKELLRTHGALVEETRACRIGGAKVACGVATVTRADGGAAGTVVASVTIGGARTIVHCNVAVAARPPLPPPCSALIELE